MGCVVEVSTKLEVFWKKGFLLPPCLKKPTPKVESDVDLSDLLDFH